MRPSIRSDVSVNEWRGKDFETFLRLTASQAKISQPHDAVRLDLVVEEQSQTSQYADVPVVVHLRELVQVSGSRPARW